MTGAERIATERRRQIDGEGWPTDPRAEVEALREAGHAPMPPDGGDLRIVYRASEVIELGNRRYDEGWRDALQARARPALPSELRYQCWNCSGWFANAADSLEHRRLVHLAARPASPSERLDVLPEVLDLLERGKTFEARARLRAALASTEPSADPT